MTPIGASRIEVCGCATTRDTGGDMSDTLAREKKRRTQLLSRMERRVSCLRGSVETADRVEGGAHQLCGAVLISRPGADDQFAESHCAIDGDDSADGQTGLSWGSHVDGVAS
ncbi:hypothetical protein CKAH01_15047 [Colletotrichum kahawae]|uniref:Uncharacterized protein n=1 Tax=Colletotrichum kahawae TaxID=34407 RepID=A0AAD9YKM9_COLKA|nr:hypothetical protein CKAH01_15047 [Colletotrichum kahawae]